MSAPRQTASSDLGLSAGRVEEPRTYDAHAIQWFAELIHSLAEGVTGSISVCAFGEDPVTGSKLKPWVRHHTVGDVAGTIAAIQHQAERRHANVYIPLTVLRPGLGADERGAKADVVAVLGAVADMDADRGLATREAPVPPSFVVSSSPGNRQNFYLFERAITVAEAEPIARALRLATGADHGTSDVAHVWRVPGTLNWPNAQKVRRGRPVAPATVYVAKPWDGSSINPTVMRAALAPWCTGSQSTAPLAMPDEDEPPIKLADLSPKLADLIVQGTHVGDRSGQFLHVVRSLQRRGHSRWAVHDLLNEHPDGIAAKYAGRLEQEVDRVFAKENPAQHFDAFPLESVEQSEPKEATLGITNASILMEDEVALQFAEEKRGQLRYCHSHGAWFLWSGSYWRRDRTKLAFNWAREIARRLGRDESEKVRVQFGKMAFAAAVERGAQTDEALAVEADKWDADPFLLGTPDGTVDLRTGVLRTADPKEGITRITAVGPAPQAECHLWLQFLGKATGDDKELERFLQQWAGYCLTGDTREHALVFLYGDGGNGKSVFLNVLKDILGLYATTAAMDTFVLAKGDRHSTELAMLRGARLVTASETEEGRFWAEARIKQMTGGDEVTARFMRQDFFSFRPTFKLTIVGNHKPGLRNVDAATRRRFNLVPFNYKPAEPDRRLEEKLKAEWPGILRWMIDGCMDWQAHGLLRARTADEATAEYFSDQDTFGAWLEERCEVRIGSIDLKTPSGALFASWSAFAKDANATVGTANDFADKLKSRGALPARNIRNAAGGRTRGFSGIALRSAADQHFASAGETAGDTL